MWTLSAIRGALARARYSIRRLLVDEGGATAVEYAIIAALISITIIAAVSLVGENVSLLFDTVAEKLGGKCC